MASPGYSYGAARPSTPKRAAKPTWPNDRSGQPASGRIAKLLIGQSHGFIRLRDNREVFFHRGDLHEGTAFNDLRVGDTVAFELLEDTVSGARALKVAKPGRPGRTRRRYRRQRHADEPRGPCKRCGGLWGTHYLTCPLLRLPGVSELPGEGELPQ